MSADILHVSAVNAVDILEVNRSYPVLYASCVVRGTFTTFLLTILQDVGHIVKVYMPEIRDRNLQDILIIAINTRSEKYNLIYKCICEEIMYLCISFYWNRNYNHLCWHNKVCYFLHSNFYIAFIICLFSAYTGNTVARFRLLLGIRITGMSSSSSLLCFVKLTKHARSPTRESPKAAGLDLYSVSNTTVPAGGKELIFTDLQIQLPDGCYGRIAPRSGLALNHHIDIGGGVIDQDYRGNVGVIIYNHSNTPFVITRGDRIAQLICEKILYPAVAEVQTIDSTVRGADGFGSPGTS